MNKIGKIYNDIVESINYSNKCFNYAKDNFYKMIYKNRMDGLKSALHIISFNGYPELNPYLLEKYGCIFGIYS
ncbi:MAG: hypothetical protein ACFFKA_05810 [Candidatus Thorarchaeota archaeon]